MTPPSHSIRIQAVMDEAERPALTAACEQLAECLSAASGSEWTIQAELRPSIQDIDKAKQPHAILLSLLCDADKIDESFALTQTRWRADAASIVPAEGAGVFLCTVFRHVAKARVSRRGQRTLERIRRLDLLAVELSHDTGMNVIDIDRVFAHIGARVLRTDYRLAGRLAAEVAGYSIASGILSGGLDAAIAPEMQERAKKIHGGIEGIVDLLKRRLGPLRTGDGDDRPVAFDAPDPGV